MILKDNIFEAFSLDFRNISAIIVFMMKAERFRKVGKFRIYTECNIYDLKRTTVYIDYIPVVQFNPDDVNERKLAAIELVEMCNCNHKTAGNICGFHRNTIFRIVRIKKILGIEAVFEDNRGPKGPSKYIGKLRTHIKKLLRKHSDWTDQQIAEQAAKDLKVEVSRSAVARIRTEKQEKQNKPLSKQELIKLAKIVDEIDRSQFDNKQLLLNFECDTQIREISENGSQEESPKSDKRSEQRLIDRLQQGERFSFAGALMHYLFLKEIGFADIVSPSNPMIGTSYDDFDILGSIFFSHTLEIPSIEMMKLVNACEFGILLGMNRAPEKETIRDHLSRIASEYKSSDLTDNFAKTLLELDFIDTGVFFIDGHFLPYYGLNVIAKGYHTVRRLAMRGNELYAITDLQGRVLFFITESNEIDFRPIIDRCAEKLINYGIKRPCLVFDRGGYGINFFNELNERADFITWAKYISDKTLSELDESCFTSCLIHNEKRYIVGDTIRDVSESIQTAKKEGRSKPVSMRLRMVVLENAETGKRIGIFSSNFDKPAWEIARHMLSRWGDSENVFKELMSRFNLNYHPGYDIKELEKQPLVNNPDIALIKKAIQALNKDVEALEQEILVTEAKQTLKSDKRRIHKLLKINEKLSEKKEDIEGFKKKLSQLPEKISIIEILKGKAMSRCDLEKKRLYDLMQFMAYNSRERLVEMFKTCYDDHRDVKKVLDMITQRAGYIKLSGKTLIVVLDWIENKKHRKAAKRFCNVLNQYGIMMEGHMNLKLSFHISQFPIHGSTKTKPMHNLI